MKSAGHWSHGGLGGGKKSASVHVHGAQGTRTQTEGWKCIPRN